jgi:D-arabinose 1-dehydrogenase-like Zn-dependent alcohol dehydrogenase
VPSITYEGGYADYMIPPAEALALIPEDLSPAEAGPLMCAGLTTFNSLRNSGAQPGDIVAILGIGGLGHLGVQFAAKLGFKSVAIPRGADKGPLARPLGAWHYIDSQEKDPAAQQRSGESRSRGVADRKARHVLRSHRLWPARFWYANRH